uniref:Uncharacterized protein n=1 Tax=Cyclocybe aegerita TaxID=1973307 RepID=A0A884P6K7_CYCAE|nr:hypothetical protein K4014_mgp30 [Cyclocybe aegerita]YP_010146963.1 hypothetical protein K4014_mgp04 [Cyclocybe aegerita]QQP21446.1 hypothetical protein [Cyclocybe aegerita]QQP21472.1 hypothetical protein [Cyclocybe aegerita]
MRHNNYFFIYLFIFNIAILIATIGIFYITIFFFYLCSCSYGSIGGWSFGGFFGELSLKIYIDYTIYLITNSLTEFLYTEAGSEFLMSVFELFISYIGFFITNYFFKKVHCDSDSESSNSDMEIDNTQSDNPTQVPGLIPDSVSEDSNSSESESEELEELANFQFHNINEGPSITIRLSNNNPHTTTLNQNDLDVLRNNNPIISNINGVEYTILIEEDGRIRVYSEAANGDLLNEIGEPEMAGSFLEQEPDLLESDVNIRDSNLSDTDNSSEDEI